MSDAFFVAAEPAQVTFVIPCYNQADYLGDCLESLRAQTRTDWAAIVIDDASTLNRPLDVVAALQDARIRPVAHAVNRGLGAARNTGIQMAQTEWVVILDSDDMLRPQFLDKVLKTIQANETADCVYTDFELFGAKTGILPFGIKTERDMLTEQWVPGPGVAITRALWERIGGYWQVSTLLGNEDWDFWLSALEQNFKPVHLPEPLYLYRRHAGTMSNKMPLYAYQNRHDLYLRHRALFDRYGQGKIFRAAGYAQSASAHFYAGQRIRAAELAWRGWFLQPQRADLAYLGVRALLPEGVVRFGKRWLGKAS